MARCLISFGANIGNSLQTIQQAAASLQRHLGCSSAAFELSRFFRTPPVGGPAGQPPFVNAVAAADTDRSPLEVWQAIRCVEQELGRQRNRRWEARRIDLDILLYEQQRIWTEQLKIPHPRMCMRRFILVPALDVAAAWVDPVSQWTVGQLAESLQSGSGNLRLVGEPQVLDRSWLQTAAELALASTLVDDQLAPPPTQTRWLAWAGPEALQRHPSGLPPAKLTMFSAKSHATAAGSWESQHVPLAHALRLVDGGAGLGSPWPLVGPRYLLAADDPQWVIHEIVSALEAMDCPIEPLPV